jgi:hypothetical protein
MKRSIFTILSALCTLSASAQLVNNGATITVQAGATLMVESNVDNQGVGVITIEAGGKLEVKGNLVTTNAGNISGPGKVVFIGADPSTLTTGTDIIPNLEINKTGTGKVSLGSPVTVSESITFTDGNIELGTHNLTLEAAATTSGAGTGTGGWVDASGSGMVVKNFAASAPFNYPVGDATNFTPLTSTPTGGFGVGSNVAVNVVNAVHPNKPADATDHLTRYWNVDASNIAAPYRNTLVGTYVNADDAVGTPANIVGAIRTGSTWTYQNSATNGTSTVTSVTDNLTADLTGTDFYGRLNVTAFLQGAYNPTTGLMSTSLNARSAANILQANATTSPYSDAPASVASNFFYDAANPTVNQDIVDWVKIEVRDPATPTVAGQKASAFIKKDGSIVGVDGINLPLVKTTRTNNLILISHRNHLGITVGDNAATRLRQTVDMTANSLAPTPFNLSTSLNACYDNTANLVNESMALVSGTNPKYCLWGGNGNSNTTVNYGAFGSDRIGLLTSPNTVGSLTRGLGNDQNITINNAYSNYDLNLSGSINYGAFGSDRIFLLTSGLANNQNATHTQHN